MMKNLTIVQTVAFAASVGPRTFNIVMIAACALIRVSTLITTARTASTSPIAPSAKSFSSVQEARRMKCLAVMLFTGNASVSLLLTIRDAPFARKQLKLVIE
jgi:hypothetical protein